MNRVLKVLQAVGRAIYYPIRLVREGGSDIEGTYPDHYKPTGPESATQASVTMGLGGPGGGVH